MNLFCYALLFSADSFDDDDEEMDEVDMRVKQFSLSFCIELHSVYAVIHYG